MIPNIDIDVNKILEIALKYRTQLTFLGMLLLLGLAFQLGKSSAPKELPLKSDYCEDIIELRDKYKGQLDECNESKVTAVDENSDEERKACTSRQNNQKKVSTKNINITNCRIARSVVKKCDVKKEEK